MNTYTIGQIILHNGRYKQIRRIAKDYIETIYCKPSESGWKRIEHLPLYEKLVPLKIGEYKEFLKSLPNDAITALAL